MGKQDSAVQQTYDHIESASPLLSEPGSKASISRSLWPMALPP